MRGDFKALVYTDRLTFKVYKIRRKSVKRHRCSGNVATFATLLKSVATSDIKIYIYIYIYFFLKQIEKKHVYRGTISN